MKLKRIFSFCIGAALVVNCGWFFNVSMQDASAEEVDTIYKEITYYTSENAFLQDKNKKT